MQRYSGGLWKAAKPTSCPLGWQRGCSASLGCKYGKGGVQSLLPRKKRSAPVSALASQLERVQMQPEKY